MVTIQKNTSVIFLCKTKWKCTLSIFVGHLVCVIAARGLRKSCHPGGGMIENIHYVKYDDVNKFHAYVAQT
jgi:hypothetical protein